MFSSRRFSSVLALACIVCAAYAEEIERPKVELVDKMGVNLATGQVTHGLTTVSIGGAMGLSHRISVYANEFYYKNMRGFSDNMRVLTSYTRLSDNPNYSPRMVFNVSDGSDSARFKVVKNGATVENFIDTQQPYTYVAVEDARHSLTVSGTQLIWSKPDGTEVKFTRAANAAADATGQLSEIVYPNGFTITIAGGGMAMQSNTGFMLKSIYGSDTRPMGKVDNPDLINVTQATTSQASGWSAANAIQIKAINTAIEYCAPTGSDCSTTHDWPTATFDWPPGMPRTMYIGESVVRIIDASGGVTKLRYVAHDLALNPNGSVNECCEPNREFSPRLVGITPPGSTTERLTYQYETIFTYHDSAVGTWMHRAHNSGVVTSATDIAKTAGYGIQQPYNQSAVYNGGNGGGISHVYFNSNVQGNPDAISHATFDDGTINFESNARNFPTHFYKLPSFGVPEQYEYDARGNLTKISRGQGGNYVTYREAKYATSCDSSNRRYCNKAEWIKDARGNVTNYTYHTASGQVASITYPANKHNVRAQTRYEYTQLSAKYFNGGSSKITGSPIWLKTAEKYCINSMSTGTGCANNDEVVTLYEYNHDNLLMTGMTVTDPATGTTLRTCFHYDKYGNQIGKTEPRANLTQCTQP